MGLLKKLFGNYSEKEIKRILPLQQRVLELEEEYKIICNEISLLNYKSKLNLVAFEDVSDEGCNKLYNLLKQKFDSITLVVGPEGGFEQREIDHLINNGFEVVSLGKRILRSETAPLFLMSIIGYMYECGDVDEKI